MIDHRPGDRGRGPVRTFSIPIRLVAGFTSEDGQPRGRWEGMACLVHGHLLGYPEAHGPADQAQPDHQVILLGAVESSHRITEEARVDEERGNSRDGMMLSLYR